LATYPSAAATHLFERGFQHRPFLVPFLTIISSGLVALSAYASLLCIGREAIEERTNELGFIFASVLILWGVWRIIEGMRILRNAPNLESILKK
jgi:hypothetical protein